jgi:hypothetical protein
MRFLSLTFLSAALLAAQAVTAPPTGAAVRARLLSSFDNLPLAFEANQGQVKQPVRYLARGGRYNVFLSNSEAVFSFRRPVDEEHTAGAILRLRLTGASPKARLHGEEVLPTLVSYMEGSNPKQWRTGIHTFRKVMYRDVYPGIDLMFYGTQGEIEFDFAAAAGSDPGSIRFQIDGARAQAAANGDIVLTAGTETITLRKPAVYQAGGSGRREVPGAFRISEAGQIAFTVGEYDHSRALVIDPILVYASYLGGTQTLGCGPPDVCNYIQGLAVNQAGEAFVTGTTDALNFPVTTGAYQTSCRSNNCTGEDTAAFVSHISADGTQLLYSTYLTDLTDAQGYQTRGRAVTLDASGTNAWVTGYTYALHFPVTANAVQKACSNACNSPDVFITEIDAAGTGLLYSTYLGGSANDNPTGIALDSVGNIYVAGSTSSVYPIGSTQTGFPTTATAYQSSYNNLKINGNYFAGFLSKLSPDGGTLLYSTIFGGGLPAGTVAVVTQSMGLGSNGVVGVGGTVTSTTMPTQNAIQSTCALQASGTCAAGWLAEFDTTQSGATSLLFATYLGGNVPINTTSAVYGVAMDAQNNLYGTGFTASHDFPTTPGSFQSGCTSTDKTRDCADAFVLKVATTGALVWETNYGNGGECGGVSGSAIALDSRDTVYAAGTTNGCSGPLRNPIQGQKGFDAYVIALSPDGSQLLFGTLFGGTANESPFNLAVDTEYNMYLAGYTTSPTQLATARAFEPGFPGQFSGFIAKISTFYNPSSSALQISPSSATTAQNITFTATVTGQSGQPAPTGTVTLYNGSTVLGTASVNASGVATLTSDTLTAGSYSVMASYSGDTLYLPSVSPASPLSILQGPVEVTIQTNPSALQFTVGNGTPQTAPQVLTLAAGTYTLSVSSPQAGTAGTQYVFSNWSDGGAASHIITVGTAPATYTATFQTQYQLTSAAYPQPGGSVTPASGTYINAGATATLTAMPTPPYVFTSWSNGSTANPLQFAMNAPMSLTANFAVPGFTCAITGDGAPSIADVQKMIDEVLGILPPSDDLLHNGSVTVAGIQKIIDAVNGLPCLY